MSTQTRAGAEGLPARQVLDGSWVDDWCAQLVERVGPGGLESGPSDGPTTIEDRYRPLERLGQGGVGEIWRAEHVGLGKEVAIKFLHPRLASDPSVRRRFLREGRLAAAVQHPGIVDVLDVGEARDGRAFLVMELIRGRTIADEIRWRGPMSWPRVRDVLVQLADALELIHARGIIHRDLKPSNIMLVESSEGTEPRCKIIDFGLARGGSGLEPSVELTRSGSILGSPAYMSPEQFRGEPVDPRSDVYSLGCLTFFMLCGRRPFDGTTPAELMYQHLLTPLPRFEDIELDQKVPAAVQRCLDRACHKRPERRYDSVSQMRQALLDVDRSLDRSRVRTSVLRGTAFVAGVGAVAGWAWWGSSHDSTALETPPITEGATAPSTEPLNDEVSRSRVPLVDVPGCGNGRREGDEQCDDGDDEPADGCEPDCTKTEIVDVHAGKDFTCATSRGGHARCWGALGPWLGQPGPRGHIGDDELPHTTPPIDFGAARVRQLHTDFYASHVCAVLDDDSARCWGDDRYGQLGHGADAATPFPALPLPPARRILAHQVFTCALAGPDPERPDAYCWGSNSHGQLGQGDTELRREVPNDPIDLGGAVVRDLAIGITNACALLDDGAVRCWGGNRNYQLANGWSRSLRVGDGQGDGLRGRRPDDAALDVQGLEGFEVAAVRMNGGWACVLSRSGEVRCWGANDFGTLGLRHDQLPDCDAASNGVGCLLPQPTVALDFGDLGGARIVDLQMGRLWGCVLDDAGAVRCWGRDRRGNLGYGPALERVPGGLGIGQHVTPAEAYAAMGHDGRIDLGDLDGDGRPDAAAKLAVGYVHACALMVDGTLRCWGHNDVGQLGYGTPDDVGDDETPGEYYAARECGAVPVFDGEGC